MSFAHGLRPEFRFPNGLFVVPSKTILLVLKSKVKFIVESDSIKR